MLNLLGIALFNSALNILNFSKNKKQILKQQEIVNKLNYLVSKAKENEQQK